MLTATGCGGGNSSAAGSSLPKVTVGTTNSSSDAPLFIAQERGYFEAEGISVELLPFRSAAEMVAPLGSGGLDVGGGSPSAGLFNALARDVKIRIVADKSHASADDSYLSLLVRKDLVDSGKFKGYADLKGLTVADYSESGTTSAALNQMLKAGGLTMGDIKRTILAGPEHISALENRAVDASITTEPTVSQAVESGAAVRFAGTHKVYPNQQIGVMIYGEQFAAKEPEAAAAFMRAFLHGARDYNDALKGGKLVGEGAKEIISILAKATSAKPETLAATTSHGVDPDGALNIAGMQSDLEFWKQGGYIEDKDITVASAVDTSFAAAASKALGPYKEKK
ncbi:ABC transporter substrate-binding protein [Arthrobacter globiformis]|uniref:ABC transporter substrate-binding protein n=1 Tax=Arthrobacter globiformis TaxID=1665 RepID=UPI0027D850C7|nr:ABC transporter substrate-binding protein [Arthrobacter globiformis]